MLKGYFNFTGFVVSDWGACHSGADALNAGLDIESAPPRPNPAQPPSPMPRPNVCVASVTSAD